MRDLIKAGCVVLILILNLACQAAPASFEDGLAAYERGDYATALQLWRPLADRGYARAQNNLGEMYRNGQGVPQDYAEAMRWYRKAADQGNVRGQVNVGAMYRNGQGVPQDYAEAMRWYRKAADQGDAASEYSLGLMYNKGYGVRRDYAEAVAWYRKAAGPGYALVQFNLGAMYNSGQGVLQDYVQAHRWLDLAAARFPASQMEDREKAVRARNPVAAKMTPAQVAEAQRLAQPSRSTRCLVDALLSPRRRSRVSSSFEGLPATGPLGPGRPLAPLAGHSGLHSWASRCASATCSAVSFAATSSRSLMALSRFSVSDAGKRVAARVNHTYA